MEPLFHKGDLVVLRTANEYIAGDIVAYNNPGIGNVFHLKAGINFARIFAQVPFAIAATGANVVVAIAVAGEAVAASVDSSVAVSAALQAESARHSLKQEK